MIMAKVKAERNDAYNKRLKLTPIITDKDKITVAKYVRCKGSSKYIATGSSIADALLNSNMKAVDLSRIETQSDRKHKMLVDALKKLTTISELKDNWNDNGAKHFENSLLVKCFTILTVLEEFPPEVFPVADNSIQMEYDGDNDSYLQFRIYDDNIRVFGILSSGQKIKYDTNDKSQIIKEVKKFCGRLQK